jgi:DDE superfamily endonuclease
VCQLILAATKGIHANRHVLSVDEKTGIQALGRIEGKAPKSKGSHKRKEFEYTRNGTTCLIAAFDVGQGKITNQFIHPTRTEEDFHRFIRQTVELYPKKDEIVFLADQLNTHMSESLVIYIADLINFEGDLGKKGAKGILKSMESRKVFLENTNHRVRFAYTPKHCSWLNPIENWFAKLQRHIIKNGNFSSVKELENKIKEYIDFYNRCLHKPLNWKFKGFCENKPLLNSKVSST